MGELRSGDEDEEEGEIEEIKQIETQIDPFTMIAAIKAQTASAPILIDDDEIRVKKKKKKKSKKTAKPAENEPKRARGETDPLKGVYYEHQVAPGDLYCIDRKGD